MRRRSAGTSITLTGRGGIVVIFGVGLLGTLLGGLLNVGVLPGLGFVIGCVLAGATTRKSDLLTLIVSPPLVFLVISVITEFVGALGERSVLQSVFVGVVTTFASSAPWLFVGTGLVVLIAVPRGLPATLRALRSVPPEPLRDPDDDPVRWDN
ncbi:MAG TPA: DUF6542 domain-containing protein [Streptosporangiaceae bacterium]